MLTSFAKDSWLHRYKRTHRKNPKKGRQKEKICDWSLLFPGVPCNLGINILWWARSPWPREHLSCTLVNAFSPITLFLERFWRESPSNQSAKSTYYHSTASSKINRWISFHTKSSYQVISSVPAFRHREKLRMMSRMWCTWSAFCLLSHRTDQAWEFLYLSEPCSANLKDNIKFL